MRRAGGAAGEAGEPRAKPATARTEAGEQYTVPGTGRISDAKFAKRRAGDRLKPKVGQKPADEGLFGDTSQQTDLVDMAKKAPSGRETWKDGRWKAKDGDKVYQTAPGFGGSAAYIHGEVYGRPDALRVRITQATSLIGGGYIGAKTVIYDHAWTVEGDPLTFETGYPNRADHHACQKVVPSSQGLMISSTAAHRVAVELLLSLMAGPTNAACEPYCFSSPPPRPGSRRWSKTA